MKTSCHPFVHSLLVRLACCVFFSIVTVQKSAGDTLVVGSQAGLTQALKTAKGGDRLLLQSGVNFALDVVSRGFEPPIIVTSENPHEPATIVKIKIFDSSGIILEKLRIDPVAGNIDRKVPTLHVVHSKFVTVRYCKAVGSAKTFLSLQNKAFETAENFSLIRLSSGVSILDSEISGFLHGLQLLEVTDVKISGNTITKIQGDGLRMGGVAGVEISDNRFQDFLGSDQILNHSDMIQLWAVNAKIISGNISIFRNRLLSGSGPASQSIFLRNEHADSNPGDTSRFYYNINISDNLIHNGHLHGITVGETNGLKVLNNTLLPNPTARMISQDKVQPNYTPQINIAKRSVNVEVKMNVALSVNAGAGAVVSDNFILDREAWKVADTLKKQYFGQAFSGKLRDGDYVARPEKMIARERLGSSLTWQTTD